MGVVYVDIIISQMCRNKIVYIYNTPYLIKGAAGAGNALTAIVAAGIAQGITPLTVPPDLDNAVDLQREVVKQVLSNCITLKLASDPHLHTQPFTA